jgi:hypothetical protein
MHHLLVFKRITTSEKNLRLGEMMMIIMMMAATATTITIVAIIPKAAVG